MLHPLFTEEHQALRASVRAFVEAIVIAEEMARAGSGSVGMAEAVQSETRGSDRSAAAPPRS